MPIYEYLCKNCGFTLEELQSIKEKPLVKCPSCGKDTLARLIGGGGSIIFKGSGFYHTDYKKSSDKKKSTSKTETASEAKTEIKADKTPAETPKVIKKESKKK